MYIYGGEQIVLCMSILHVVTYFYVLTFSCIQVMRHQCTSILSFLCVCSRPASIFASVKVLAFFPL
jgi:hypothetical protein